MLYLPHSPAIDIPPYPQAHPFPSVRLRGPFPCVLWLGADWIRLLGRAFPNRGEAHNILPYATADRPAALQRVVDSINAQTPDLICFTGDIVTIGVEEAMPFKAIMQQLHARNGIFSVLGNHDLMIYRDFSPAERLRQVEQLVAFERDSLGWKVLRDTSCVVVRERQGANSESVRDSLTIVGVDNCSCEGQGFRSIYHGDLAAAMRNTDGFRILLSHDPTLWRAEVQDRTNIPLTLSGHTHSGQLRLFGHPLAGLLFQETAGWYYYAAEHPQALYVNSGVGCTLPVRVNCPAEITVITLHRLP